MKAAVYEQYGAPEVVSIREVPTPTPAAGEVLIRVHATTVSTGDWRARSLEMPPGFGPFGRLFFGISRPRQPILGTELSGTIAALGAGVSNFAVGDEVFAFADAKMGAHAEFRCIAADGLVVKKPARLTFEQAAAISFGGMTMIGFYDRAALRRGERVLVNGASGAVGSAAVQLARHAGAEVTAVCSAANADIVRALGATHVIDYAREDFATTGQTYDVIVDTVGNAPYARVANALVAGGRLLAVLSGFGELLRSPLAGRSRGHRVIAGPSVARVEDLQRLAALAAAGDYTPLIDRTYEFAQIVEAHRRVETKRKRGSVVVMVSAA
ncbi:MAG: NAD(P)-dependent alcohol dehydrogenase [Gemmatimonadaceae bacterium]|nr:NAD(P)-dependent alcohol dehydrogenase [Gemmatimonadaceae bacterium]MCW5826855.1 NAD(P)-dependent alcohol dehydrogenase [Gemmatimonadaceae bacterium]